MERYRFELIRIGTGDELDETLVALEGTAELVGRMSGGLAAEALGAERAATTVVMPSDRPADAGEPEQPKRKRRTKAEIAADEAAAKVDAVQQAAVPVGSVEQVAPESAPAAANEPAPAAAAPATPPAASGTPAPPYDPFA